MGRGRRDDTVYVTAAALGAIAGLRSVAAPALLSHEMSEEHDPHETMLERVLSSENTARLLTLLAGAEMIFDKTDAVGDRTSAAPLIGRTLMGSMTAAAFAANKRRPVLLPALIGGATAVAVTFAAFHLRRLAAEKLNLPDRLLGMIEDALVVGASRGVAEIME
jgi:uncharacterized membrane protein